MKLNGDKVYEKVNGKYRLVDHYLIDSNKTYYRK